MPNAEASRVSTTLPLEIGGKARPVGTELELSPADAQAMVDAGRALWCGEPLKGLTDEDRAALPRLDAISDAPAEIAIGVGPASSEPVPSPLPADPAPHAQEA